LVALGAGIVTVAIWVSSLTSSVTKNTAFVEAQKEVNSSVRNQVNLIQGILDDRKHLVKEVEEMWFMKEHGIPNKEDFYLRHPELRDSSPTPEPKK